MVLAILSTELSDEISVAVDLTLSDFKILLGEFRSPLDR